MTERDLIKQVVEKSITKTTEIEPLRAWCKERYEEWSLKYDPDLKENEYANGRADAFWEMIQKLDELEVSNGTSSSN